jgi:hypothetical protein
MVFHRGNPPGNPVFVADRDGSNAKQIFIDPNTRWHCHYPVWSRDGKWIYFVRGNLATLEMDLWRISPSGGEPERLTHHNSNVACPAPIDTHTVLYVSPAEDGSGPWLYALDVDRKLTRRVTVGLEQYLSVATSADGRRAVATVSNPTASLWRVPISDTAVGEEKIEHLVLPMVHALAPRQRKQFVLSLLAGQLRRIVAIQGQPNCGGLKRVSRTADGSSRSVVRWKTSCGLAKAPRQDPAVRDD